MKYKYEIIDERIRTILSVCDPDRVQKELDNQYEDDSDSLSLCYELADDADLCVNFPKSLVERVPVHDPVSCLHRAVQRRLKMTDNVNHPKHYESQAIMLEPIDFYERLPFCEGNALKYCFRAGHKHGSSELEDLKKARWYLFRAMKSPAIELNEQQAKHFELTLEWMERSNSPLIANNAALCCSYGSFFAGLLNSVEGRITELEKQYATADS